MKRPPIIAIVGHVDHGKTTLLDYVRKTNVVAGEAGGITQATHAYAVMHEGHLLTFIDTPGHQAFGAMRERGARVADVAVLVVASTDGVEEQTKEAIRVLEETQTPYVVALTKTDMNVPLEKVKGELMQAGVLLEGFGGSVSWAGISAKTGDGVSDLLDLITLTADVANLEYDETASGAGYCIEATKDSQRGVTAYVVVLEGVLKVGAEIVVGEVTAKVKALEDSAGKRIAECPAGLPCAVIGFKDLPPVGITFRELTKGEKVAPPTRAVPVVTRRSSAKEQGIVINAIIKADAQGPLEALTAAVQAVTVPEGCKIRIALSGVGDVTDGDVQWFVASETKQGIVLGFNVASTKQADYLAKANRIEVVTSKVIYDLVDAVDACVLKATGGAILGDLEVLALFGNKGAKNHVIGGTVTAGEMKNGAAVIIIRADVEVGMGTIDNLQTGKKEVGHVEAGNECGLLVQSDADIRVGDRIVIK
ncbi:MAG: GTP-binding protein [Candidatus Pacebacteria bacterium]|nr:GTP-binding protein [Candidatus Paceibacterota bacterium]